MKPMRMHIASISQFESLLIIKIFSQKLEEHKICNGENYATKYSIFYYYLYFKKRSWNFNEYILKIGHERKQIFILLWMINIQRNIQ